MIRSRCQMARTLLLTGRRVRTRLSENTLVSGDNGTQGRKSGYVNIGHRGRY